MIRRVWALLALLSAAPALGADPPPATEEEEQVEDKVTGSGPPPLSREPRSPEMDFQLPSGMYSYLPTQSSVNNGAARSSGTSMHRPA